MDKKTVSSGGMGFASVLTIVFIVLKVLGVINWNWVWVLSPLWIGALLVAAVCVIMIAVLCICELVDRKRRKEYKRRKGSGDSK
jgi:membrane protein YdbS with pleckstrin-like domain